MLFHTLYAPRSGVYVQQLVGVLREELDVVAFRRAWEWVLDRHPVLRTSVSFAESSRELLQRVHTSAASSLSFEEQDWRGLDVAERSEERRGGEEGRSRGAPDH